MYYLCTFVAVPTTVKRPARTTDLAAMSTELRKKKHESHVYKTI